VRILLLGGTRFLGRHIVDAAERAGYDVVLFNRGHTNPDLYPELETVIGDRDGGLSQLEGRRFDAVIDTSGYVPRIVRQSAQSLSKSCDFYAFMSSISVYPDGTPPGYDESAPTQDLVDAESEDISKEYGALKAACERVVEECFPGRSLNVRAGLIVGPHDPTGRFTYWVERIAVGGDALAPAPANAPVQFIDARDLAEWTLRMIASGQGGVFNVTGPRRVITWREFLEGCARATGSDARFTWVSPEFLLDRDVQPWSDLPLWLPGMDAGMLQASIAKALDTGLRFRTLDTTVADIQAWIQELPGPPPGEAGLPRTRESDLLEAWRQAS
jgi:2'-hydroxyisoflavone reductase